MHKFANGSLLWFSLRSSLRVGALEVVVQDEVLQDGRLSCDDKKIVRMKSSKPYWLGLWVT